MNIHHLKRPAQEKTQLVMVRRSVCHIVCMNDIFIQLQKQKEIGKKPFFLLLMPIDMKMFKRKKERKKMYE